MRLRVACCRKDRLRLSARGTHYAPDPRYHRWQYAHSASHTAPVVLRGRPRYSNECSPVTLLSYQSSSLSSDSLDHRLDRTFFCIPPVNLLVVVPSVGYLRPFIVPAIRAGLPRAASTPTLLEIGSRHPHCSSFGRESQILCRCLEGRHVSWYRRERNEGFQEYEHSLYKPAWVVGS